MDKWDEVVFYPFPYAKFDVPPSSKCELRDRNDERNSVPNCVCSCACSLHYFLSLLFVVCLQFNIDYRADWSNFIKFGRV